MKKFLLAVLIAGTGGLFAQNPAPEMGSIFSSDGLYDIGRGGDLRPGVVNIAKGLVIGAAGTGAGGVTYTPANGAVNFGDATVTQITSLTTGVTVNGASGVITTVSATVAALSVSSFTVTNSAVAAGSAVNVCIVNYGGTYFTNGTPYVTISNIAAGSFVVNVLNLHTANALAGVLKISFQVE